MDKQQAKQIIRDTFEGSFDQDVFTRFIKNLLNRIDDAPFTYQGNYIPDAYKQYIKTLERIGKFNDGENNIDILVITLQKETSLERARTMQRNFISWYLNGSRGGEMKDAALVAFVSPGESDWRFSLVKMDYKFEQTQSGKMKVKEEFTPARRWSFLVGSNEKSHTAQSRLVNILANDEQAPTLKEIENAFDIETVTKEFFLKYRELFLRTKEELDQVIKKDPKVKADFEAKGVDTVNFAKKLLGQIVFLYFLQKKGWFGVGRDDDWGTGSKHFIRKLFEKRHGSYTNFFNDILEPLYYDTLRNDRSHDDHYCSRFDCKIPFLNGGLFDPIGNYDWVHTDIRLPNNLFSNKGRTKEGDIGDGILDVFDRYNFTVREDEPLEKEVAIDPELLGKVYEKFNAIRPDNFEEYQNTLKGGKKGEESKFNKQYGVYYTPREIVHYMCQQSLINYLHTELNSGASSYQKVGDVQTDAFGNKVKTGQLDLTIEHPSSPLIAIEDIEILIHFGEQVSANEVRVLNEGRETKTYFYKLPESIRGNAGLIDRKLEEITVCDPAVGSGAFPLGMMNEIVRARTVLTNFIKTKANRTPYDFKRRCIKHSLYGVDIDPGAVEIAKLRLWLSLVVDEDDIKNIKPLPNLDYKVVCGNSLQGVEKNLFNAHLFSELEKLKPLFFNETNPTKKQEYKKQIDHLISQITSGHTEFDFDVYFSEVFHSNGGFDVVIANPPYGTVYDRATKSVYEKKYETFKRNNDIYVAFYQRGIELSKYFGELIYISPNTFLNGDYFKSFREYITIHTVIKEIRDYKEVPVFEDPTVFVCILNLIKQKFIVYPYHVTLSIARQSIKEFTFSIYTVHEKSDAEFKSQNAILKKIVQSPTFLIDEKFFVKDVGFNYWTFGKGKKRDGDSIGDRVFYSGAKTHAKDIAFIKGRDIEKWIVHKPSNYLKHNFKRFLNPEIDTLRYSADFLEIKPKIVYRQTANTIIAAIDNDGNYLDKTVHIVIPKNKWVIQPESLVALLNSRLFAYLYSYISQETEGRAFAQVKTTYIKKLPIPTKGDFIKLANVANQILAAKRTNPQSDTSKLEGEIDQLVYQLYGLTEEEIKIVEGKNE